MKKKKGRRGTGVVGDCAVVEKNEPSEK